MYIVSKNVEQEVFTIENPNNKRIVNVDSKTNYNNYKSAPPCYYKKTHLKTGKCEIINISPKLAKRWNYGDFIHDDNVYEYQRLTQFEFDRWVSENATMRAQYPDNHALYSDMKNHYSLFKL